jgi:hypothetical protein
MTRFRTINGLGYYTRNQSNGSSIRKIEVEVRGTPAQCTVRSRLVVQFQPSKDE